MELKTQLNPYIALKAQLFQRVTIQTLKASSQQPTTKRWMRPTILPLKFLLFSLKDFMIRFGLMQEMKQHNANRQMTVFAEWNMNILFEHLPLKCLDSILVGQNHF